MTRALDAIERVHQALTGLAQALETGQPDQVLAAEHPLADATDALTRLDRASLTDPVSLRARLLETRLALQRCRALGDASGALIDALTTDRSYGPAGQRKPQPGTASTVNSQV